MNRDYPLPVTDPPARLQITNQLQAGPRTGVLKLKAGTDSSDLDIVRGRLKKKETALFFPVMPSVQCPPGPKSRHKMYPTAFIYFNAIEKTGMQKCKKIFLLMFVLLPNLLVAQFWGAKTPRAFDTPGDSLKKGEFTWAPELAPAGPILVTVSLHRQLAYTYRNGVLIGTANISSGKKGHETPTGVFVTILKDARHRSSKYNNAAMPYTQKFTSYGVALHAGGLPGYPSSHGCVHLPSIYAQQLFSISPLGMTVVVTNKAAGPETAAQPSFLSPVVPGGKTDDHEKLGQTETYRWKGEKASEGPVSMLVSRTDKRMIVMRNGREIGRSKVAIKREQDSLGTVVYVYHGNATSGELTKDLNSVRWISIPLSDGNYGSGLHHDTGQINRIVVPGEFSQKIMDILSDGTTLMVTDASIISGRTGKKMAVLSSSTESR